MTGARHHAGVDVRLLERMTLWVADALQLETRTPTLSTCARSAALDQLRLRLATIRCDTRCYFNLKADMTQLSLPH